MKIITKISDLRKQVDIWRKNGENVGLVPTMGYLHEGHKSLIEKSVSQNDKTIVSIFVNPMQFGPTEDLDKYPRDLQKDTELCTNAGADIIFHPEDNEMYKNGFCSFVDMNILTEELCGKSRPVHFRGVCTVVLKLFNIVNADRAYFGEKDAQQLAIIRRMVEDLNVNIEIIGCPIVREMDGLAKSSRNTYLNSDERESALVLNRSLKKAKELLNSGEKSANIVKNCIKEEISKEKLADIDYIEVVDTLTMKPQDEIKSDVLVAIAVKIGSTRLIDNFTFKV